MDLKTLQYPRHVHRDGQFQIVNSPEACDVALDAGWVLSPGAPGRPEQAAPVATTTRIEHDEPAHAAAESSPSVDSPPEPSAPVRKPGRPEDEEIAMPFTYGSFTPQDGAYIQELIGQSASASTGSVFYLDPANGNDSNTGASPAQAFQSVAQAYAALTSGKNDTIYLIGDGSTTATARVNAAFTWAKSATRLIGVSSGVNISNRSRIAPTGTTTAFANFFTVSGSGCVFSNIAWFHGFNTGTTSAICMTVSGGRNLFLNCHIGGMGDAASAQSAGSRSLKIATTGENMFVGTTIGLDTVTRTAANASVEFAGVGNPRNQFIECVFPFMTSAATPLGIICSAAAASDRFQYFKDCAFINAVGSTSTTMSGLGTLAASIGGLLLFKDCTLVGITEFGTDATSRGQIYVDGGTVTAATSGIAVNPT